MSKVTLASIASVCDARLDEDEELEFLLGYVSGRQEWIARKRISHQTLRSNLFVQFYSAIGSDITTCDELQSHLEEEQGGQQDDDDDDDLADESESGSIKKEPKVEKKENDIDINHNENNNENDNKNEMGNENDGLNNENSILLEINNVTMAFLIDDLKLLSYFEVLLSDRWMTNRAKNHAHTIFVSNQDGSSVFGFDDIKLLIKCVQIQKIDENNILPKISILEGLVNADDYLMNRNDSIINEKTLIDYFNNVQPRLTFEQRKSLVNSTNNELLKSALMKHINELNNKIRKVRGNFVSSNNKMVGLDRLKLDKQTVIAMLIERMKTKIRISKRNRNRIMCDIIHLQCDASFQEYRLLWNRLLEFKLTFNEAKSVLSFMINFLKFINNNNNSNDNINNNNENKEIWFRKNCQMCMYRLVLHVLNKNKFESNNIIINNNNGRELYLCDHNKLLFGINSSDVSMALWRILHDSNVICLQLSTFYPFDLINTNIENIEKFTSLILNRHEKYIKLYSQSQQEQQQQQGDNDYSQEQQEACRKEYFLLLKKNLIHCSHKFIIKTAKKWFPIIHEQFDTSKSYKWILKDIIKPMNATNAFDFGIYLTQYIAYNRNIDMPFPKQYFEFLKNDLGIEWEIK